jgi:hypothetical protein
LMNSLLSIMTITYVAKRAKGLNVAN